MEATRASRATETALPPYDLLLATGQTDLFVPKLLAPIFFAAAFLGCVVGAEAGHVPPENGLAAVGGTAGVVELAIAPRHKNFL